MLLCSYPDAVDEASDQEDSGTVPDQQPDNPDAGGTVPDQQPDNPDAGGIENDGGDNIVDSDTGDDVVSDGSDDFEASSGSGLSDGEGEDASDLEGDASDLDTLPSGDADVVSDFNPEYYISDGILYSSDGVALDRDVYILPASVTASNAVYTPTAWQVNLAENRKFGEHYLMWAQRVYSGSSYYWRYYLALGRDIRYASNVYTYVDAEVFSYYSYNSSVTYDVSVSSGTVSGSTYLVYSDLYFDYVGVDPAVSSVVYVLFFMFIMLFAILMRRKM